MIVFLVVKSTGSYDDFYCGVDKVFSTRENAEAYISNQKRHWDDVETRIARCMSCPFASEVGDVKNREMFENKALKFCPDAKFDWAGKAMPCRLYIWDDEIPSWSVEEYEVIV